MTEEILARVTDDGIAHLVLNRPQAINALTDTMFAALRHHLDRWADDDAVGSVEISGAGDRGFCAGADVRLLAAEVLAGRPWLRYLTAEYELDAFLAGYPKPTTAHLRGVTMGGGLGLGAAARVRHVDETSRLAMPETKIGIFPDAGVLYWLARGGAVGTHLALTGATFTGGDALRLGLADHSPADLPAPLHDAAADWMTECYDGDDVVAIAQRLDAHPHPDAQAAGRELRARSPFAVAVALGALRRAATMTHTEVLAQDLLLMATVVPVDFTEGVRALLVDKDHAPRWRHARVEDVPADLLAAVLAD